MKGHDDDANAYATDAGMSGSLHAAAAAGWTRLEQWNVLRSSPSEDAEWWGERDVVRALLPACAVC